MFDTELIEQLVQELDQSKNTRTPLQQFTQRFPDMTIQDGYKISRAWVAMQIPEPDYGTLLDDMLYTWANTGYPA